MALLLGALREALIERALRPRKHARHPRKSPHTTGN